MTLAKNPVPGPIIFIMILIGIGFIFWATIPLSCNNKKTETSSQEKQTETDGVQYETIVAPPDDWSMPFQLGSFERFEFLGEGNFLVKDGRDRVTEIDISKPYNTDLWSNLSPAQAKFSFRSATGYAVNVTVKHWKE